MVCDVHHSGSDSTDLFFFNDTATTEIYTLSLHDALPISGGTGPGARTRGRPRGASAIGPSRRPSRSRGGPSRSRSRSGSRSEEHTSELQSPDHLVCRLLLEKKNARSSSSRTSSSSLTPSP